ncbi:MAG: hypothetical protein MZV70_42735 [Desulfobacterales bacterium]|nr:hypothetical protein [Desulfobacterales bacterium]
MGAGVLLGAMFFGGLWWTVRRGVVVQAAGALVSRQPAAADEHRPGRVLFRRRAVDWERLLACLARIRHRALHRDAARRAAGRSTATARPRRPAHAP